MDTLGEIDSTRRATRTRCPVCMGGNLAAERKIRDHMLPACFYTVSRCRDCSARFVADPPAPETIQQYYTNPAGNRMRQRDEEGLHYRLRSKLLKDELKPLFRRLPSGSNIIDFGAGDGSVSSLLRKMEYNVLAMDVYPKQEWPCPEIDYRQVDINIPLVPIVDSTGKQKQINAVVIRHALEHLYDPVSILTSMRDANIDFVLIVVPNYNSILRPLLGEYWYYWDPPRHLTYFTKHSLYCLSERAGYKMTETTTYAVDEIVTSFYRYMMLHGASENVGFSGKLAQFTNPKSPLAALSSGAASFFGNCVIHALLEKYRDN